MEVLKIFWQGILNTSIAEWLAVLLGMGYVILIAKRIRIGWWFAFISSCLFVYLCVSANLFIEASLQLFYVAMALYGWFLWNEGSSEERTIIKWPIRYHTINITLSALLTLILAFIMSKYTSQENPYLDAFTTIFSLAATFMAARRVLENWLYWIFINIGAMFLYAGRELYLASFQYLIFTIIAIFAYYSWIKTYKNQKI